MSKVFKVGERYVRNGRMREIVGISRYRGDGPTSIPLDSTPEQGVYYIRWRSTPTGNPRECWCSTWLDWADKAELTQEPML